MVTPYTPASPTSEPTMLTDLVAGSSERKLGTGFPFVKVSESVSSSVPGHAGLGKYSSISTEISGSDKL